jgi:chromosome partitioning protein
MIISIASQKGGTGKTSTTISIAVGLARRGKKVLLIDVDSQANSSKLLLHPTYNDLNAEDTLYATIIERKPLVVHESSIPNLFVVPSHILLSNSDLALATAMDNRGARLKNELDKIKDQYDVVIIDCPPALSFLTLNAFVASDQVIVVASPGYFELDSIVQIQKTLAQVRQDFDVPLQLRGFLFTMSDSTVASKTSLQLLRQTYTNAVFKTVIPRNTDIRNSTLARQDIYTYNEKAPVAQAYSKFIRELFAL